MNARGRSQEHDVEEAEHRHVHAESEREGEDDACGHARLAPEGSQPEADIVNEVGHELDSPVGGVLALVVLHQLIAHLLDVAEAAQCIAACLPGWHAEGEVALDAHGDVELQLIVDVGGRVGTNEAQVPPPARRFATTGHEIAGSACSTRVTAVA